MPGMWQAEHMKCHMATSGVYAGEPGAGQDLNVHMARLVGALSVSPGGIDGH